VPLSQFQVKAASLSFARARLQRSAAPLNRG
jgi:hypothetical protein